MNKGLDYDFLINARNVMSESDIWYTAYESKTDNLTSEGIEFLFIYHRENFFITFCRLKLF